MDQNRNAAIWYVPESYDASCSKLPVVGRTAAGEGFLGALAKYGNLEHLYCYSATESGLSEFNSQVKRLCPAAPPARIIQSRDFPQLEEPGCLYVPEPVLEVHAWNRRSLENQRKYSLCGVTHTTAHHQTIDAIGALLTAPMQSWDALICTSNVVRSTVIRLLEDLGEYLQEKGAGKISRQLQLPVIPLGIASERFAWSADNKHAREELRQRIGVQDDDILVLYMGRLSVNIKTNPYSMLACLEKAVRQTGRRVCLVLAGWFQDEVNSTAFYEGIKQFCPSVNTIMMDGRQDMTRRYAWFAADIFVSLIDNVQETFGITPLEAMAAGLPVVVTDWDGYRDTVLDGETGFRINTMFPQQGAGVELATRFAAGIDSYEEYLAHCSAATVIDEAACVAAFKRLIEDGELRRKMGEHGRRHVRENFDWQVVIGKYQDLWQELAQRRAIDNESVPLRSGSPVNPLRQDPFRLFSEYPTALIDGKSLLRIGATEHELHKVRESSLFAAALPMLLVEDTCSAMLKVIGEHDTITVSDLESYMQNQGGQKFRRSLAWLAKTGFIKIDAG